MDMDVNNIVEDVFENVSEDAADQMPVEAFGEQITPKPRDLEQEGISTMLDEVAFQSAD